MIFKNRADAGAQLAQKLIHLKDLDCIVVIGLPRGGVVIAAEVASALHAPLEVIICRKIGAPENEERGGRSRTARGKAHTGERALHALG